MKYLILLLLVVSCTPLAEPVTEEDSPEQDVPSDVSQIANELPSDLETEVNRDDLDNQDEGIPNDLEETENNASDLDSVSNASDIVRKSVPVSAGGGGGGGSGAGSSTPPPEESSPEPALHEYFAARMVQSAIPIVGQPVDGFSAGILLDAYPGIIAADFDGVRAEQGTYYFNGTLNFNSTGDPEYSAAERVTDPGYLVLLQNLRVRLEQPLEDQAEIEELLLDMQGS